MKILIVEDNTNLRQNISFLLKKHNFLCEEASNGEEALLKISKYTYDIIILDINMPVLSGGGFLKKMRSHKNNTPVIVITSDSLLEDKLSMFDLGADDYLVKPFDIQELIARIKVLSKRGNTVEDSMLIHQDIILNTHTNTVEILGENIMLPIKQYLILEYLLKNKGYSKNKTEIMSYVWGEAEENLELHSTTLESHIYALRKVIGKDIIQTKKGYGYIIL